MDYLKYYRPPKSNDEQFGQALRRMLKIYGLQDKLIASQLPQSWEKLMGSLVMRQTEWLKLEKGCLWLKLKSAALRQEIFLSKDKIIAQLNEELGGDYIEKVEIR